MSESKLTFDEVNHKYYVDGKEVPGVTTMLKDLGIIDGAFFTEEGAENGKRRHKLLEDFDAGELDWSTIDPQDSTYLVGWQEFLSDNGFRVVRSEQRFFCRTWHFAGTTDRILADGEDQPWLVDLKTGSPQRWHKLQLFLYAIGVLDSGYVANQPRVACVYLRPAKGKKYRWQEHRTDEANLMEATSIVRAWQWQNEKWPWVAQRIGVD